MRLNACLFFIAALISTTLAQTTEHRAVRGPAPRSDAERLAHLEKLLDGLRGELKIPALSAAVVKDQKVLWARGFGYADLEKGIPATEHTSYHLASLTKTFASTILMQLVQEGEKRSPTPTGGLHLMSYRSN